MAALTLHVVSIDAAPVAQGTVRAFDVAGGSIGRDETNSLALPDKHRRVSRLHATISFPGGLPTITNSSTSLPLSVGEQQLDGGESMPLVQGALIEIGPYILQAQIGGAASAVPEAAPGAVFRQDTTPTMLPVSPVAAVVPYGHSSQAAAGSSFAPPIMPPHSPISAAGLLPDSFGGDLSAFFPPGAVAAPAAPAPMASAPPPSIGQASSAADPFADLLAGIGGSPAPSAAPNASLFVRGAAPSELPRAAAQQAQSGLSADPLAAFGGASFAPEDSYLGRPPTQHGAIGQALRGVPEDEFNAFQMPSGANRNAADPLAGLLGASSATGSGNSNGAPSIDSLFQSGGSGGAGSSAASPFAPLGSSGHGDGTLAHLIRSDGATDPMALFDTVDELSAVPEPVLQPMRDDRVEVGSAFSPPLAKPVVAMEAAALPADFAEWASPAIAHAGPSMAVVFPQQSPLALSPVVTPAPKPIAPPIAAPVAAATPLSASTPPAPANTLTDAFLLGAGLTPSALPHGLTPEIMTVIGSLLRSATAGAVDMLAARAATKREVQASVTIISVQANNPLKFLPNADSALLQLLGKKMPGFMRADVAMRDAFDDLRAHEVGVIAGTRAALTEVLGKFDPAILGDKLARGSVIDSLMPSARKAKLWDLYLERYLQIRREAEDDFQSIFGRAFVQAYERETARIKGESPMAGGE